MEYPKDLAQIALAALVLASASPVEAQADHIEPQGLFLATGCEAHGCPSKGTDPVGDSHNGNKSNISPTGKGSSTAGRLSNLPSGTESGDSEGATPQGKPPESFKKDDHSTSALLAYNGNLQESYPLNSTNELRDAREYSVNGYNSQRSGITNPVYIEDYHNNTYDSPPLLTPEESGLMNLNREYNTTTDYDYNRSSVTTVSSFATLTEAQLLGMLSSQGRSIYLNLDPEGKALAIQLGSQDSYKDKNHAVREAQRRMSERRGLLNR